MTERPDGSEYAPFYAGYVKLVPEGDILATLEAQLGEMLVLLSSVSESESLVRHAPYTWSVREVVGHMTDAERVFGYRALRFSRSDATPLASFDENAYTQAGCFDRVPLADLVREFEVTRRSNLLLFRHLSPESWSRGGKASDNFVTVRALAHIIVGHARHHTEILRKRLAPGC
ncbi:MAG: DinB family protein [Isosphaeraceae bacterium]